MDENIAFWTKSMSIYLQVDGVGRHPKDIIKSLTRNGWITQILAYRPEIYEHVYNDIGSLNEVQPVRIIVVEGKLKWLN